MATEIEQSLDAEAETVRFYSECADNYLDGAPWGMDPEVEFMLYDLLREAGSGALLLDIGCGHGRLVGEIYLSERYLGIDASEPLIEIARRRYQKPNVEFRVGNMLSLSEVVTEQADVCVSFYALSHISRARTDDALREIRKVMKLGGTGLLHFIHGEKDAVVTKEQLADIPEGYRLCLTYWTAETLTPRLNESGFEVLRTHEDGMYITFMIRAI